MLYSLGKNSYYSFINTEYYRSIPTSIYCISNFAPQIYQEPLKINAFVDYNTYYASIPNISKQILKPYYVNVTLASFDGSIISSSCNKIDFVSNNIFRKVTLINTGEYFFNIYSKNNQLNIISNTTCEAVPMYVTIQNDGRYEDSFLISYSDFSNMVRSISLLSNNNLSFDLISSMNHITYYGNKNNLILNYKKPNYSSRGIDWAYLSNDIYKTIYKNPLYEDSYFIDEDKKIIYGDARSVNKTIKFALSFPDPTIITQTQSDNEPAFESISERFLRVNTNYVAQAIKGVGKVWDKAINILYSPMKPISFVSLVGIGPIHASYRLDSFFRINKKRPMELNNETYLYSFNIQPIFSENILRIARIYALCKNVELVSLWRTIFTPYYDGLFRSNFVLDYSSSKGGIYSIKDFKFETSLIDRPNFFMDYRQMRNLLDFNGKLSYNMYLTSGFKYSQAGIDIVIYHKNKCLDDYISSIYSKSKPAEGSLNLIHQQVGESFSKLLSDPYFDNSGIDVSDLSGHFDFISTEYCSTYGKGGKPNNNKNENILNMGIERMLFVDDEMISSGIVSKYASNFYSTYQTFINHNLFLSTSLTSLHPYKQYALYTISELDSYGIDVRHEVWRNMFFNISAFGSFIYCNKSYNASVGLYLSDSVAIAWQMWKIGPFNTTHTIDVSINVRQLVTRAQNILQGICSEAVQKAFSTVLNSLQI